MVDACSSLYTRIYPVVNVVYLFPSLPSHPLLPSERVRGISHATSGVPIPKQECVKHSGGTPYTPRQTFPAEEEAQERNPQGRAATEM